MKIEIKSYSDSVLFSHECPGNTIKKTVEAAVKTRANLTRANLTRANFYGADLTGANLTRATLTGAILDDKSVLVGKRPVLQIGPIGSRGSYFVAYVTNSGLRFRTGCFFGTREEFEAKLTTEHGDNDHAKEYRAALALCDAHLEIWGEK